jgi:hypothetical protein
MHEIINNGRFNIAQIRSQMGNIEIIKQFIDPTPNANAAAIAKLLKTD